MSAQLKSDLFPGNKCNSRKGCALINAQRAADGDTSWLRCAVLAQFVEIDGKPVLMEGLEEIDLFDVMKLQEVFV